MNKLTNEWLEIARADLVTAKTMLNESDDVYQNIAAYHCQQAAEKIIKSIFIENKIEMLRTHSISELISKLDDSGIDVAIFNDFFVDDKSLEIWAEKTRYVRNPIASRNKILEAIQSIEKILSSFESKDFAKGKVDSLESEIKSTKIKPIGRF